MPERFATVIHLGAGPYFDEVLYRDLRADRIILIEADPESATNLRESVKDPRIEVVEQLIAPEEGPHSFHRFTLPSLNGFFAAGEITRLYPRVREVEYLSLDGRTLRSVLSKVKADPDLPNLLILDVTGLESALLRSLHPVDLEHLDWIIICDAAHASLMEGASPLSEGLKILDKWHFSIKAREEESDSASSLLVLGRDHRSMELQELRDQISELTTQLQQANQERDNQTWYAVEREAALEDLKKQLADAQGALEAAGKAKEEQAKLAAERHVALEALDKELEASKIHCDAVESKRNEFASQNEKLAAEKAALDARLSALGTECDALTKEREEQAKLAVERQAALEDLKKQLADTKGLLEASIKSKEEQAKLASERQAVLEALNKQLADAKAALEAAGKAKEEQAKLAAERQAVLEALNKQLADAKAALEAAGKAKEEQAKLAAERQAALNTALKARDENANALKSQTSEINQLKKNTFDKSSRIADLEAQVEDQAERQRLIEDEMLKAETQLEMLKEFMLPSIE
jgi:chromosome segregation ATPase